MGDQTKALIGSAIDGMRSEVLALADDLFAHAELGYRETRTSGRMLDELRRTGLDVASGIAVTGLKARLPGARPGPTVAVLGELDGLPIPDHPQAFVETGAAHACGHHAQLTHLAAVARALTSTRANESLDGDVVFMAVPAEEYVELGWREEQARLGRLEFLGGKAEMIRLGAFDDVDIALLVHANAAADAPSLSIFAGSNGFVAKRARFRGRAAHAARPWLGVNALNAASLALQMIHAQRETFRDEDHVRVHPIMTHGGAAVNVVPDDVRLEMYVRAVTTDAITGAAEKVDRALRAGALGVGAGVEIETLPGYLPLVPVPALISVFRRNALALVGEGGWRDHADPIPASTDAGDLSHVIPVLHPSHGGCSGTSHGKDFSVRDAEAAYLTPAKAIAWTIVDLLRDGAREARAVIDGFRPRFTRDGYVEYMRSLRRSVSFDDSMRPG